jgi:hypothetical protein
VAYVRPTPITPPECLEPRLVSLVVAVVALTAVTSRGSSAPGRVLVHLRSPVTA